jgi:hypothetical protein
VTEPISLGLAIGGGAWLADKVLGPSAEGMGEQLKAYAGDRLRKIFNRAEDKTDPELVRPLPPGFAMIFVQRASSSEDDPQLTEMWANLLKSAATSFSSRHTAYAEILSQLTPFDVSELSSFIDEQIPITPDGDRHVNRVVQLKRHVVTELNNVTRSSIKHSESQEKFNELLNITTDWPMRVTQANLAFENLDGSIGSITGGRASMFDSVDNLVRLGLLERFSVSNSTDPYLIAVEGYFATGLGVSFVQTCRGKL